MARNFFQIFNLTSHSFAVPWVVRIYSESFKNSDAVACFVKSMVTLLRCDILSEITPILLDKMNFQWFGLNLTVPHFYAKNGENPKEIKS